MTETELVLTQILHCDRISLYLNKDRVLDRQKSSFLASILKRRISGEPIQYILGETEFMGLVFKVNRDVFIPRPETEILVETAIRYVNSYQSPVANLSILEIGTGSGCIAISLAKLLSNEDVTIIATDISHEEIRMAKYNARLNNVTNKIKFIKSDLFASCQLRATSYEMIISNPAYIATQDIVELPPEIRCEPGIALDGGKDGLDFYRRTVTDIRPYLKKGGFLIMEMGFDQKEAIERIFQSSGNFKIIEYVKDYHNIDRVIVLGKA